MKLIENSSFDYLQLEFGDLKLTLSKTGYSPAASVPADAERRSAPPKAAAGHDESKAPEKPAPKDQSSVLREGTVPIAAPMVGTFYTTPSPGAPPFVGLGDRITQDSTVGLIEVMKVFNAVTAGVSGTIAEVCVQNGQFIEYGQPLFLVTPDEETKD
jgi:acetyl-CoA carboxylase biotin carboxyl carrier protein